MSAVLTLEATTVSLFGVGVLQSLATLTASARNDARTAQANALGALVCAIAWSIYRRLLSGPADKTSTHDLRHVDWILTCPLMLYELYVLLGRHERLGSFAQAALAITACIALGRVAATATGGRRAALFGLATLAFALMLWRVGAEVQEWDTQAAIALGFLGVWAGYPLAFWSRHPDTYYNVLDMITKGVFGLVVAMRAFA